MPPLYALLVSVSEYPGSNARRLPNAGHDADDLEALLADGCTFVPQPPVVQRLSDRQASKAAILAAITGFLAAAPEDATVLFYFAGHGIQLNDNDGPGSYLLLAESVLGRDGRTAEGALSASELQAALDAVGARRQFIVLDCCHAYPSRDVALPWAAPSAMAGLHRQGRALLAACRPDQLAGETARNGMLTHHLLEGLRGAAANPEDGNISLVDLAAYVLRQTSVSASQVPVFAANKLEHYLIARGVPDQVLEHAEWRLRRHKLARCSPDVLEDLMVLFDLPRCPPEIGQSGEAKVRLLIDAARARGTAGGLELDRYLSLEQASIGSDVMRRRISQDLLRLDFVHQGLEFETCLRPPPPRGAFLVHGPPLSAGDRTFTAHRWLVRRLLFRVGHVQRRDDEILLVDVGALGRDSRDGNLRAQLKGVLGTRSSEWPRLVAKALDRGPSIFIIEPINELGGLELDEFRAQFWQPLNEGLDQRGGTAGPVLLFLLSHEEQAPTEPGFAFARSTQDGARTAGSARWLEPIKPLPPPVIEAWLDQVRGYWSDNPDDIRDLIAKLAAADGPYQVFDGYVDWRMRTLGEDQWHGARTKLKAEWFLSDLPKR